MSLLVRLFGENAKILGDADLRVLLLVNLIGPLGPALVSPILSSLTGPFGVTEHAIGLMVSVYLAPAIFIIPFVGLLTDRYGPKIVLTGSLLLFGVSGSAVAFTTDFQGVLALRFLQGIGGAALVPTIIISLGDLYSGSREVTAQGLRLTTSGFSQAVFPLLAGILVVVAWQYALLLYAFAIPVALLLYAVWDDQDNSRTDREYRERPSARELMATLRQPPLLGLVLIRFVPDFLFIGFITYNSVVVTLVLNGTPEQAGLLVTVVSIVYAVSASQSGRLAERFSTIIVPMQVSLVCSGGGLGIIAMAPTYPVAVIGAVLLGSGFGLGITLHRSAISHVALDDVRGGVIGAAESLGKLGQVSGPVIIGVFATMLAPLVGETTAIRWSILGGAILGPAVFSGWLLVFDRSNFLSNSA